MKLIRITAPHYCAGIAYRRGRLWKIAPIIAWMRNLTTGSIKNFCRKKGYKYEEWTI